ncbi:MAG: hypothetical protein ABSE57_33330, partial [Bryobacteraceae bacterium]
MPQQTAQYYKEWRWCKTSTKTYRQNSSSPAARTDETTADGSALEFFRATHREAISKEVAINQMTKSGMWLNDFVWASQTPNNDKAV